MNEKVGIASGEAMGEIFEIDSNDDQLAWGKWLRVTINFNVHSPLKLGKLVSLEVDRRVLALFKYERLPDFCYCCGRLDHQEIECNMAINLRKKNMKAHREFRLWLRAEGLSFYASKSNGQGSSSFTRRDMTLSQKGDKSNQSQGL